MALLSPLRPPSMPLSVSLIIVNFNSWQVLTKLLQSLLSQELKANLIASIQVIIVDNHSSQPMPDFSALNQQLQNHKITTKWILNPQNVGFASGCNIGAAEADSDLLLFCNPDIEIPPHGLYDLVKTYQQHKVDLLAPMQTNKQGQVQKMSGRFPSLLRYVPLVGSFFKQASTPSFTNNLFYCDWISGAVILMKNHDFKQLKGWDTDFFMFMEDVDLCRRAAQMGLTIGVTNKTTWLHHHGISSKHRMVDRVRSKSAALAAKHIYIKKHFMGWRKYLAQGLVSIKYIPELMLGWLLSWFIPKPVFISRRLILHSHLKDLKNGFKKSP